MTNEENRRDARQVAVWMGMVVLPLGAVLMEVLCWVKTGAPLYGFLALGVVSVVVAAGIYLAHLEPRDEAPRKLRIYIAGPISKGDLEHNIRQSDVAFEALVKAGFAPMNPMWSCFSGSVRRDEDGRITAAGTQTGGLNLKHADWLGSDLPWVEVAEGVLRLPGESTGADMETAHALKHGIPVFTSVGELISHFQEKGHVQP